MRSGFAAGVAAAMAAAAMAARGDAPRQVLILHSHAQEVAPFSVVASAFRTARAKGFGGPLSVYEVPLDMGRFPAPEMEAPLVEFLERRFAGRPLDLVVCIGSSAGRFAASHRDQLFPTTPVLFASVDSRLVPPESLRTNAVQVTHDVRLSTMVEDILRLRPGTTNIAVVFGATPVERYWVGECRREFQPYAGRVGFEWLEEEPLDRILQRCSALPPRSFILFGMFVMDAARVPYGSDEALTRLRAVANAPIFGYFESQLGLGAIGGRLYRDADVGERAASAAIRILRGESAALVPPVLLEPSTPVYDARELQRWGIREADLPTDRIVRFREPTFWTRYRGHIAAAVALILVQSALIVGLLVNRRARRDSQRRLRESEERLSLALESANAGAWSMDLVSRRVWASDGERALFGFAADEPLTFDSFQRRIHPDDREAVAAAVETAQRAGTPLSIEYRVLGPDGGVRWIASRGHVCGPAESAPDRLLGVSVSIDDRKRAEEALRRRDRYIETILDRAPIGFAVHTIDDGVARFVSARFETICGVPRGTIDTFGAFFDKVWPRHADLREEIRSRVSADLRSGDALRLHWENIPVPLPSGETRYITAMNIPLPEQNLMVSTVQDVTERVRAETSLKESEARYRLLADNSSDVIWTADWDGRITYVSPSVEPLLGFTVAVAMARPVDAGLTPASAAVLRRAIAQLRRDPEVDRPQRCELERLRKDGSSVWTESGLSLLRDASGIAQGVLIDSRDITERRRLETTSERLRDEIAHLTRVTTMGELTAALAHELHQPLTAILNNAHAARRMIAAGTPDLEEIREIVMDIVADDQRAGDVIRRVRSLVKKAPPELQSLDLADAVAEVVRLVDSDALIRGIHLNVELPPGLPRVRGDRIQLQQVILNLVVNGFDAMKDVPGERSLTVRAESRPGGEVVVTVLDSGPGIPPDRLDAIFTPFFSTKPDGLGMGLAICRTIVASMGGRIWAENAEPRGARVQFSLPVEGAGR